jgi:hypothetical protein
MFSVQPVWTQGPDVPLSTQRLQQRRLTVVKAIEEGVGAEELERDTSQFVICMNNGLICTMSEQCFNL